MKKEDLWKIFTTDKSVMILTDCPKEYDVYKLMKPLQKYFGWELCSTQKFDERFDKIEDFDIILRTGYNIDGNRLLSVHLFEYDKEKETVTMDRQKTWKIVEDREFVYSIKKTIMKCIRGWNGFREHILWTMGKDSCWTFWGDTIAKDFGLSPIMGTDRKEAA